MANAGEGIDKDGVLKQVVSVKERASAIEAALGKQFEAPETQKATNSKQLNPAAAQARQGVGNLLSGHNMQTLATSANSKAHIPTKTINADAKLKNKKRPLVPYSNNIGELGALKNRPNKSESANIASVTSTKKKEIKVLYKSIATQNQELATQKKSNNPQNQEYSNLQKKNDKRVRVNSKIPRNYVHHKLALSQLENTPINKQLDIFTR